MVLHIRYNGESREVDLATLNITLDASDQDVKQSVANFLDIAPAKLNSYTADRHENGNITLRPNAEFA
jgi:hypothetical protein